jgi:membrane fusion protein (multidrug efflux system)
VKEAEAEARRAEAMAARMAIRTLRAKLDEQKRAIEEARSLLELARIDLARTVIYAPASGNVTRKNVYPGNYVQPGQPLLAIVDPSEVWIVANFKETQVEKMRVGQPVDIRVDAYPGKVFKGRVDSFQHGTGSVFSLLPPNNATGSFVKVVQRVPVKIVLDGPADPRCPLWPGLSVVPHVDVGVEAAGISG